MYLNGLHVFPLVKMDSTMHGYFMDGIGNVYSNKTARPGSAITKLAGTKQPSGHYFTLNKRTFRADDLIRKAKAHKEFASEIRDLVGVHSALVEDAVVNGRTKSAKRMISLKGYVLATVGPTDRFVFGTDPVLHVGESTAKEEAARIANLKPGTEVVILKVHASVVAGGVTWK